ncbi:hypothetical protein BJ165DRAFT_1511055 [Panaeolus papilionaceus]|nr:hypothetical protein BJ165DRAFT_1511055 [Panaeolus papilionaceus]
MATDFAQRANPVSILRSILAGYPFSIGLFQEIIQNSEDAGAKEQIFVLDRRRHDTEGLYHENLAAAQGPALLAFNDAYFEEEDWLALQNSYESSKTSDSSKIGKFGVGFRSVFHLTDCPQIMSGDLFALFDPLKSFTDSEGKKLDIAHLIADCPGQLASFKYFIDKGKLQGTRFKGTVVRCPLRTGKESKISSEIVKPARLSALLGEFAKSSLELSLLFLKKLERVTVVDIDEDGTAHTLASLDFTRSNVQNISQHCQFHNATTTLTSSGTSVIRSWNIVTCPFSGEQANSILAKAIDDDVDLEPILKEHKLHPHISIAALSNLTKTKGRFFTYLPLPIFSSFGIHINAVFALTSSRQHLLNSQDFGVARNSGDHILREWNKTLFDDFIPRAWKEYLEYLVSQGDISSQALFDSWPTLASQDWKNVPLHVFEDVVASESPIWPLLGKTDAEVVFKPLQRVLIAKQTEKKIAEALSVMGLEITSPPAYIFDFISLSSHSASLQVLTPERAHEGLLKNVERFRTAPVDTIRVILDYLLSTSNCLNLVGLPIIPTSAGSGKRLSLEPAGVSGETHTLLDSTQARIFGGCDDDSISVSSLPSRAGGILLEKGPGVLNVQKLSNDRIVQYLQRQLTKMGPNVANTIPSRENLNWISSFWEWFGIWVERVALRQMIEDAGLTLMPCTQGLKPLANPVFKAKGMQPLPVRHLSTIGIAFVHSDVSARAHDQLASLDLLKQISNVHDLLDALPPAESITQPAPEICNGILKHISVYATPSCNSHGPFSLTQLEKLKGLPIYPVLAESLGGAGTVTRTFRPLPTGASVRPVRRPPFLPTVSDVVFVELDLLGPLLNFVATNSDRLDDNGILSLSVEHFLEQKPEFQATVLEYITKRQGTIPPQIRERLADKAFVTCEGGSLAKPSDVIDPESPIACLFIDDLSMQPKLGTEPQRSIVESLRKLKFLKSALTPELIADRATHISRHHSSTDALTMADNLLKALCSIPYIDLSSMPKEILDMRWLPTSNGLQSPNTTRDDRADIPRRLFDRVLSVLAPEFDLKPYLRHYFGWDQPLPFTTLVQQFEFVLASTDPELNGADIFETVSDLLEELSERPESFDTGTLEDVLDGARWVPTTDGTLVSIHDAVFNVPSTESGFRQISVRPIIKDLLIHLGCMDKPNVSSILLKLTYLKDLPPSLDVVKSAVILLGCLPAGMSEYEREAVFIPDITMVFQLPINILFNDIGDKEWLIPDHGPLTHPLVTEVLANRLGLQPVGLQYADLDTDDIQMGVDPLIQVQKVLEAYTEGQFLTEFVANAVDAGATSFKLFLEEGVRSTDAQNNRSLQVLSPSSMQSLVEAPTLVIYNNSVFTDVDFRGICETSVGGKRDLTGTIGQFGLGAATMFYFTEMALVVSGRHVLFLNPSGEYLPGRKTALRLPLKHVKSCYPDHLCSVNGQFGFDATNDDEEYDGTLFVLPLRTVTQLALGTHNRFAERKTWDRDTVAERVIKPFGTSAPNCLLFTCLCDISAAGFWSFTAAHTNTVGPEEGTGYYVHDIQISAENDYNPSTWRVVSSTVSRDQIPSLVPPISSRIRDPVAGFAARLHGEHTGQSKHNFFSTLPLQITTLLPVHVMASFILSSDRRNIRLDEYDNSETSYNRWLLEVVLPPLYLFLLERLAFDTSIPSNRLKHCWPGHRDATDNISRHLIKSFYGQHLASSLRRVFIGEFNDSHSQQHLRLVPSEAVITGLEPSTVRKVLDRLQPSRLVKLSDAARERARSEAKLSLVNPSFLREEIYSKIHSFRPLFQFSQEEGEQRVDEDPPLSLHDLEEIIKYLHEDGSQDEVDNLLEGLPILPLSNGEFGTFVAQFSSPSYYAMPKLKNTTYPIPHRFSSSKFVHPGLSTKTLVKLKLNVSVPTEEDLVPLIREQVVETSILQHPPGDLVDWILGNPDTPAMDNQRLGFWDLFGGYNQLGLSYEHVREFPLVPTLQPHVLVSLANCQEGTALVLNRREMDDDQLRLAFEGLELDVVERDSMSPNLRRILETQEYRTMTPLDKVLKFFEDKPLEQIKAEFEVVDEGARLKFAEWVYNCIDQSFVFNALPEDSPKLRVARLLPIWPSASQEEPESKLCSACEIHLLPAGVQLVHAVPYINSRISDHPSLHHLKGPRYQYADIPNILDLPDRLEDADLGQYRNFLVTWLYQIQSADRLIPIPVPNTSGYIRDSSTLYARSPLFVAAYGEDGEVFVSPLFSDLQHKLSEHGLKTEDQLDMDVFRDCVDVIDRAEDNTDRISRAARVFEVFCNRMSVLALQNGTPEALRQFDDYRFIPRSLTIRRRRLPGMGVNSGLDIVHEPNMEPVLRPTQLVREEFEAVAWSQRGLFNEQPDKRVLSVYPDLGKPTLAEVVLHLEYLASLTPHDTDDRKIITHDAKASYNFLMKNMPTTADDQDVVAQESLPHDIQDRAIFLNINEEPVESEPWTWCKATELVYNAPDEAGLFSVRSFLKDFQTLLMRVGATLVHRPSVPRTVVAAPEGHLKAFKEGFDALRRNQRFVDVVFKAKSYTDEDEQVLEFWAHRSFLSVSSAHFEATFAGDMIESREDASKVSPIVMPSEKELYHPCVEHILDYIYSSSPLLPPDLSLNTLLEMLSLAGQWYLDELVNLIQEEIINENMIIPQNVDGIEEMASELSATMLREKCHEFREKNPSYIHFIMSQNSS